MSGSYSQKLKDPRWQRKRLEALQAANWACKSCKSTYKTLHVHHTRYRGEPWEVPLSWLEVLCEDCHEKRHAPANPLKIYFAGKIGKNDWRHKLIPDLRGAWNGIECGESVGDLNELQPVTWEQDGFDLQCTGPYFVSCDHGCFHGDTNHGQISDFLCDGNPDEEDSEAESPEEKTKRPEDLTHWLQDRERVYHSCESWLAQSEVIFAYIDDEGAYGTIAEILSTDHPTALIFSSREIFKSYWFLAVQLRQDVKRGCRKCTILVRADLKKAFSEALVFFRRALEEEEPQ